MSYSVLYYPKFQPELEWLKSMLLVSDTVERIVPEGVDLEDPTKLRDLLTVLPDSLVRMAPRREDVELGSTQLERLDRVFHFVAARLAGGAPAHHTSDGHGLDEMIRQRVFLHQAKASPQVRELLVKHNLIEPKLQYMEELMGVGDRLILPELASNFLLSIVAERMGGRTGRDVVTDDVLPASFLGIDAIATARPTEVGAVEGQVGQSFVRMFIPQALNRLPLDTYLKLREEFSDLRYAFRQLVRQAAAEYDLNQRPETQEIEQRIREATIEYSVRYADFRKRDVARTLDSWGWFSAVNAVSLLKTAAKPFALALSFLETGLKLGEKRFSMAQTSGPHDATFKMLVRLDDKLMKTVPINEWL